jgi:predicted acyltransferase
MEAKANTPERVLSIDIFRGFTMFLLMGEASGLYRHLSPKIFENSFLITLFSQVHHHPWNGLHFWDLIQPYFMFIVGLSLPFAVQSRIRKGDSQQQILHHVIRRSMILLLLGWYDYCIGPGRITWRFQDVLAQIAVTYVIAYLIMNRSFKFQVIFSLCLLLLNDLIYQFFPVEGFNQAYVDGHNFGNWLDQLVGSKSSWASFNAIPTAAHTIWGVLAGKLLMSDQAVYGKLKKLAIAGSVLVIVGYFMNPIVPIIKHIATSSFVIVSGGWTLLTLALFFWIADIKKWNKGWPLFFGVVSMNSLFIYVFFEFGGARFVERILHPITYALFDWGGKLTAPVVTSIFVWAAMWGLCYFMYKKRLFIKI